MTGSGWLPQNSFNIQMPVLPWIGGTRSLPPSVPILPLRCHSINSTIRITAFPWKLTSTITRSIITRSNQTLPGFPATGTEVIFGGNAILYDINRGEIMPWGEESSRKPVTLGEERGIEGSLQISDQVQVSDRLSIYAGLRYSLYAYLGPQTVYNYTPDNPVGTGIHRGYPPLR